MKLRKTRKIFLIILVALSGLIFLLFLSINLPFGHRFVTNKVNGILSKADLPIHITAISRINPESITLKAVTLSEKNGDTIAFAGEIQADFVPLALLKKRIVISDIRLNNAKVSIVRKNLNLNISDAFSSGKKDTILKDPGKKQWEILLGQAEIRNISFQMNDSLAGIFVNEKIEDISIKVNNMSLPGHYVFIKSVEMAGAEGNIKISSQPQKQDTTAVSVPWNISLSKLDLGNINQNFNNEIQDISLNLGKCSLVINKMDLGNKILDVDKFSLAESGIKMINYNSNKKISPGETPEKGKSFTFPWNIAARNVDLEKISIILASNNDSIPQMGINDLMLTMSNLIFNKEEKALEIDNTSFNLDNGFSMEELKGDVKSMNGNTSFNLSVKTANSQLEIESKATGDLIEIISDPSIVKVAALSLTNTELSLKDLLYFKPDLKGNNFFTALAKSPVFINMNLKVSDSVMVIPEIKIKKDRLSLLLSGNITNAFKKDKQHGSLKLEIPDLNIKDLKKILEESGLQKDLPDIKSFSLTASLEGSTKSAGFNIGLTGDLGQTIINGTFDYDNDNFYAKSVFKDILPGKILRNPMFGPVDGNVEIKGKGIRHKELVADIIANIDSLNFKGYKYSSARLELNIDNKKYDAKVNISDPNIKCDIVASLNTFDSIIDVNSSGSFEVQLNKLNLLKDTLKAEGNLKADFKKENNLIQSDLTLSELKFTIPRDYSTLPESTISFRADSMRTVLNAAGDFFDISVEIEKPFGKLGEVLAGYKSYVAAFIDSSFQNRLKRISYLPELKAEVSLHQNKALSMILNDTTFHFGNIEIKAMNIPESEKIKYTVTGSNLKYKQFNIGRLQTNLTDSAGRMNLGTNIENCRFFSRHLDKIAIQSSFFNQQGITDFSLFEKPGKILYDMEISSVFTGSSIIFSVPSRQMTMNGVDWQMDSPDLFTFDRRSKAILPLFTMHTDSSLIDVKSDKKDGMHAMIMMKQVDIASLLPTNMITGKPSGSISGTAELFKGSNQSKDMSAEMSLNNISWSGIAFRSITLKSSYKSNTSKDYSINLTAGMDSSKIELKATKPETGDQHINAILTNLAISDIQPFVKKFLSDLKGKLSGNIDITKADKLKNIDGELDIDGASVRIITLNSIFKIPSDKLLFTGDKIVFNSFKVLDSLNNELIVDGSLNLNQETGMTSDLEILSKNLQVMRSTEKDNPTFFGTINVDTKLSIKGPVTSPDLKGNVVLAGGTEIFFREKENLTLTETEKVLTFVSPVTQKNQAESKKSINTKTTIDAIVKIDPETKLNFQLAKRLFNIDLMIQGGGELNYNMLANKDINLAGKYEISDGTADVKITGWPNKSFTITKGGYVRWDGRLDDPELNFQAVNKVHSSYLNPVDNKQRDADFNVTLKLANRLSTLELLFTINTPDQYLMSIINTLSPEEQMRQAITILLFAKIDLPGISTSSDYMTEQVNQLVASQLNQLTKTTISGIDISFGIDSYVQATETGAQETKTSLSYEVKKALLNNRAQIEVSGRLNDVNKQPGASDLSLNNVSFEYRLDSAGTKFLKVYNEHTYEDVFEGEVIKTGVGLTYRKNYPTLKDIWKRKNKKHESNKK